jgi:hypothetical protein
VEMQVKTVQLPFKFQSDANRADVLVIRRCGNEGCARIPVTRAPREGRN